MVKITNFIFDLVNSLTPNSICFHSGKYVTNMCDKVTSEFIVSEKTPKQTYKQTRTITLEQSPYCRRCNYNNYNTKIWLVIHLVLERR